MTDSHVLMLTETWLYGGERGFTDAEIQLTHLLPYRSERKTDDVSKHGGVLIAVDPALQHRSINLGPLEDITAIKLDSFPPILLVCAYNPPAESPYRWSLAKWKDVLSQCKNHAVDMHMIITGDLNMLHTDWNSMSSTDPYESAVLDMLDRDNLMQISSLDSCASGVLDIVLCNADFVLNVDYDHVLFKNYNIHGRPASNHKPIQVTIPLKMKSPVNKLDQRYSYCKADYEQTAQMISDNPFT